jgi:hypothetical protein
MTSTEDESDSNKKQQAIGGISNTSTTTKKISKKKQLRDEAIKKQLAILAKLQESTIESDDEEEDDEDHLNDDEGKGKDKVDGDEAGGDEAGESVAGEGEVGEGEAVIGEGEAVIGEGEAIIGEGDDDFLINDDNEEPSDDNVPTTYVMPSITLKNGNYDYITIQHDDRLEIKLPWLETGYDWNPLNPQCHDVSKNKKKLKIKTIPYDMFPEDNAITNDYGYRYFKHIHQHDNVNLEPTDIEISNIVELLCSFRDNYKAFITEIIYKFWFDIAKKIGICSYTGQAVRDNKSLVKALQLINNEQELHKIQLLLNIIFDWLPDYQKSIMDLMEIKFPIKILKVPLKSHKRSAYHCIHLLITKVMTQERKNINKNLNSAIGIKVYMTREKNKGKIDSVGNKIIVKHPDRVHHCIYPYMIRGNFVSNNFYELMEQFNNGNSNIYNGQLNF